MDFAVSLVQIGQRLPSLVGDVRPAESRANAIVDDAPELRGAIRRENRPQAISKSREGNEDPSSNPDDLSDEDRRRVDELKARDAEVRAHERAHARTGGPYTGLPVYEYENGPDGGRYAVSGEVSIDTRSEDSAEATIQKMETVIRAALAPAEPSAQDRAVANAAKQVLAEAKAELREERQRESESGTTASQSLHASAAAAYRRSAFAGSDLERGSLFSLAA